jgi:hypothetical protein
MVSPTNSGLEGGNEMLRTKICTAVISLAAVLSFAGASVVPSAAQAQWHTYCTAGHCTTHTNYTIGGVSPCSAIGASYGKAYEGLLDALQAEKELPDKVHPEMTPAEAQAAVEAAEAQVNLAGIAAFEWGCGVALQAPSSHGTKAPVHAVARAGR